MDWFRGSRSGGGGVEADLRKITDAEVLDVPKDALMSIVQASHSSDDRRIIMNHLRVCLCEPVNKHWRRIYGGLVVVEQLLQRGSRALMIETSEGHHFDLVQRLTFLADFEFREDIRVQAMVRQKAAHLRIEVLTRMENPDDAPVQSLGSEDAALAVASGDGLGNENSEASPPSLPQGISYASASSATPTTSKSSKSRVINGSGRCVVSVGHHDDTTSDSSGAEDRPPQKEAPKKREEKRRGKSNDNFKDLDEKMRHVLNDSTDSDSSSDVRRRKDDKRTSAAPALAAQAPPAAPPPVPAAQIANLLDM